MALHRALPVITDMFPEPSIAGEVWLALICETSW